jgi:hypothetical protein
MKKLNERIMKKEKEKQRKPGNSVKECLKIIKD